MKKILFLFVILVIAISANAQVTIFVKFTPYSATTVIAPEGNLQAHVGQIPVASYSSSDIQTLNIGSQSTGAGAGKLMFSPIIFTKSVSANSPLFFSMMASGTPFQKIEFFFYDGRDRLMYQETLKLAAINIVQHTVPPCTTSPCPTAALTETITIQYGGKVETYFPVDEKGVAGKPIISGWNRIKNVRDDDPNTIIQ
jgi:type VI protein secretion system component Hcp